jgi:branched-chain amino acid transport system substrate-binding protein
MTLPRDDNNFDGVDPETRMPPLESLSTDPVEKPEAANPHAWFWFEGRGRAASSDSTPGPSSTGAPTMISRAILLAAIAIVSIGAYFAGSGAFKPYYNELFGFFSPGTAPAPGSLPKEVAQATTATSSDHDQASAPSDLSRSPERPAVDTQRQTPLVAAKPSAVPQTAASLPKDDLSRPPDRPAVDTQGQTHVAAAKSSAAPPSGAAAVLSPGSSGSLPATALASPGVPAPAAVGDVSPRQSDGTESTVQGVSEKEILFGMAAPFSGASRELGRQIKIGVETAFSQVNSAGGVNGRLLRLVAADDGYEPEKTPDAMRLLYDQEKVFGFIGNVGTPTAAVALPFALDHRALFFGAFTGANLLRRNPPDRYVFNYRASYGEETKAVVHYLVKVRHIQPKEIVVFAQQDSYGDSGYAGVQKAVRSLPGDNPDIVRLNYKRNTVDVQGAVDWLRAYKGAPIKAVVMIASYRAAAKFIEKTRDLYPSMIYTNVSFVGSTALADELMLLGPRYASGVIVTQVVPAINSYATIVLKYKEALAKYFPGESPDYVSFEGYIDASILAEAVKRVGPDINTEKLVEELERMHDFDLGLGAPITFSPNDHQGSHKVSGTELDETGHYQPIDLE